MMVSFAPEVPVGGGEPGTVRVLNLSSTESIESVQGLYGKCLQNRPLQRIP